MIGRLLGRISAIKKNVPSVLWQPFSEENAGPGEYLTKIRCTAEDRDINSKDKTTMPPSSHTPHISTKSSEMMNLAGKVAIVIGGCTGVGLVTTAELLRRKLSAVVMTGCNKEDGPIALQYLKHTLPIECSSQAHFLELDVTNKEQYEAIFQKVLFKHKRIDMLFNAGGIMDDSMWEREVDTNVYGLVRGVLLAFRYMGSRTVGLPPLEALVTEPRVAEGVPIVVNMAGIAGLNPLVGAPVFSLTQSAAISLTRSLGAAYHLGRTGVRVTCLCVGLTPEDALLSGANHLRGKLIEGDWSVAAQEELTAMPVQQTRVVAEAVIYLTKHALGGTVWTVEDSVLSQVEFPRIRNICKKCRTFRK